MFAFVARRAGLVALAALVVLVLDAEVVLGLLLAGLDLAVVLSARLLPGHLGGLVHALVCYVRVLAGELLRLVHEFRHGFSFPVFVQLVTQRRRSGEREQPRASEFRG